MQLEAVAAGLLLILPLKVAHFSLLTCALYLQTLLHRLVKNIWPTLLLTAYLCAAVSFFPVYMTPMCLYWLREHWPPSSDRAVKSNEFNGNIAV